MGSVFTASFVYSVVGGSRDMVMINVANEVGERRGGEWGSVGWGRSGNRWMAGKREESGRREGRQ